MSPSSSSPPGEARQSLRQNVALRVVWARAGRPLDLWTADVSAQGMFLQTDEIVPPRSIMDLDIHPDDGDRAPLRVRAVACFAGRTGQGHGVGVHLLQMLEPERLRWERVLARVAAPTATAGAASTTAIVGVVPAITHPLRQVLRESGLHVADARDGDHAFDLAHRAGTAVVVSDVEGPGTNGLALCRRLTADKHMTGVGLILLAHGDHPSHVVTGLRAGADYVILKPYDEHLVLSRIAHLVRALDDAASGLDAPAEGASSARREPRPASGMQVSQLRMPTSLPAPLEDLANRASDAWFLAKLYAKDRLRRRA